MRKKKRTWLSMLGLTVEALLNTGQMKLWMDSFGSGEVEKRRRERLSASEEK
jgi:hypothetical protein